MSVLKSPSLRSVHNNFVDGYSNIDDVVESYRVWLDWIFYVIIQRFNFDKGDFEYSMFRGVKRGDDKYSWVIYRKFKSLARFGKDLVFFNRGFHGYIKGSALLVTLEYDSNRVSLVDAWSNVGVDLNRWICGIRRKFKGGVSMVRCFESHESGYPHVHALLIFHKYFFDGRSMKSKKGKLVYRVIGSDLDDLKFLVDGSSRWVHGFTDFEMVSSYQGGIRYLSKYLSKSTSFKESISDSGSVKAVRTLAMCWIFHKRSYGYQGEMFASDEIRIKGISNLNSPSSFSNENSDVCSVLAGFDLHGNSIFEKVSRWRLFGFCVRDSVLWSDWESHVISGFKLVCVSDRVDKCRSYYDVC